MVGKLTFQIGSYLLEMNPESYLLDAEDLDKSYAGSCIFGLISTPNVVGDM